MNAAEILMLKIKIYIMERKKEGNYASFWRCGFSKSEKINAAECFLHYVDLKNQGFLPLLDYQTYHILKNGRLGKIISSDSWIQANPLQTEYPCPEAPF